MSHDVIVIGAGVNGLVAAHALARSGRSVLVLERAGQAGTEPDIGWVAPQVLTATGLPSAALIMQRPDPWLSVALPGGGRLDFTQDVARTAENIRRVSPNDAAKWPEFCARMHALAGFLGTLYTAPPPDVETTAIGELLRLAGTGLRARKLGRQGMIDLLRVLPMSVADLLGEWFTHDALKGALGAGGIYHQFQGPRGGGTAFTFLHHAVGNAPGVFRPEASNLSTVLAASPGITLRTGAPVASITVAGGRATGVTLASGEALPATLVVSGADPRATLLGMIDPAWLDPEFRRAVRNVKCRGIAATVTLEHTHADEGFTRLAIAPSLDHLERAYDDAKHGRVSAAPYIEALTAGGHTTAHVQFAPHTPLAGPWTDAGKAALGETVRAALAAHAPGLAAAKVQSVVTPSDLETHTGLTGGHVYHGELTLDQILFMRPVAGWGRYATPIAGLYLCGAGTHPGGAIAGAPGANAAAAIRAREAR